MVVLHTIKVINCGISPVPAVDGSKLQCRIMWTKFSYGVFPGVILNNTSEVAAEYLVVISLHSEGYFA
jgi:hypothetical protein